MGEVRALAFVLTFTTVLGAFAVLGGPTPDGAASDTSVNTTPLEDASFTNPGPYFSIFADAFGNVAGLASGNPFLSAFFIVLVVVLAYVLLARVPFVG